MFYLPVLMSPQTLQNRLGMPLTESSRLEFVVCCCILIGATERDELMDLRFDLNLISSDNSLFTICSSSFNGRFKLG